MTAFAKIAVAALIACGIGFGAQSLANSDGGGAGTTVPFLPMGMLMPLNLAGPLAVSPDGTLYVADVQSDRTSDRILVRLADGQFRVVAGNGVAGYSGDGRPAIDAELTDVTDMAFSPNGDLYVADGSRVRVITPEGIIRTVAGDGQPASYKTVVANGTPAMSAALYSANGTSLAVSPVGVLYIADGNQVLYLDSGRLDVVHDVIAAASFHGQRLNDIGQVAIDNLGNIDISGFNGWAIWRITPDGVASEITYARRSGGDTSVLERAPDGSVYGEAGSTLLKIEGDSAAPGFSFKSKLNGEWFWLDYFAFSPSGSVYADDIPGDVGFEAHQQLVSETGGHVSLLWQEGNKASY